MNYRGTASFWRNRDVSREYYFQEDTGMPDSKALQHEPGPTSADAIRRTDRMGAFFIALPKWVAFAVIAWQIRLSVEALTGKYAFPSLLTRFWRQASVWEVVCWMAAVLGMMFGFYSRHLLHRQVARDLSRLDGLEQRIDNLSVSGTVAPGRTESRF
jgi:hypothetical protein